MRTLTLIFLCVLTTSLAARDETQVKTGQEYQVVPNAVHHQTLQGGISCGDFFVFDEEQSAVFFVFDVPNEGATTTMPAMVYRKKIMTIINDDLVIPRLSLTQLKPDADNPTYVMASMYIIQVSTAQFLKARTCLPNPASSNRG